LQPESGSVYHHARLNNSLVGVQVTVPLMPKLSFTGQVLGQYDDSFSSAVNWAFLKYQFNPTWSVSAGRFRVPVYMYSSTYQVGSSYPWVVPPTSVYYMVPFYNMDGVRATFRHALSRNWSTTMQAFLGDDRSTVNIPLGPAVLHANEIAGLRASITNNIWTFEASYMHVKFDLDQLPQLQHANEGGTIVNLYSLYPQLNANNETGQFVGLGAKMLYHSWLFISELGERFVTGTLPAYRGGYVTFGRQIGKWLPTLTFSGIRTTNEDKRSFLTTEPNAYDVFDTNQNSITAAMRYTINKNMDVKLSVERVDLIGNSFGFFGGFKNGNQLDTSARPPSGPVYIARVAFDVLF
jgi:hypothetical protein